MLIRSEDGFTVGLQVLVFLLLGQWFCVVEGVDLFAVETLDLYY